MTMMRGSRCTRFAYRVRQENQHFQALISAEQNKLAAKRFNKLHLRFEGLAHARSVSFMGSDDEMSVAWKDWLSDFETAQDDAPISRGGCSDRGQGRYEAQVLKEIEAERKKVEEHRQHLEELGATESRRVGEVFGKGLGERHPPLL